MKTSENIQIFQVRFMNTALFYKCYATKNSLFPQNPIFSLFCVLGQLGPKLFSYVKDPAIMS